MANPNAILEPQITLDSLSGDTVILSASPEWKQKLADFLQYAATTDDMDADFIISGQALADIRNKIFTSAPKNNTLRLKKTDFLHIGTALTALSGMSPGDFYDYPPDDFDRLHDDLMLVYEKIFNKSTNSKKRVKTGISGEFYG